MVPNRCPRCEQEEYFRDDRHCSLCGWSGGDYVDPESELYTVFLSLVVRASNSGKEDGPFRTRVLGSARESAMIEPGHYCKIDGVFWHVFDKYPIIKLFTLRSSRIMVNQFGFYEFGRNFSLEEIDTEVKKWSSQMSGYEYLSLLQSNQQLEAYLAKPESDRSNHRSMIQGR